MQIIICMTHVTFLGQICVILSFILEIYGKWIHGKWILWWLNFMLSDEKYKYK